MLFAVNLRHGRFIKTNNEIIDRSTMVDDLEIHVLGRLALIERQVAAIGYMDTNPYWGFGLYECLKSAFVPRSIQQDKPPIDTGVYLKLISEGNILTPPIPLDDITATSWPDRHLAGFLSFGLLGLSIGAILSGLLFGAIYRLVLETNGSTMLVYLYGTIGFLGATPMSPLGIVKYLITVACAISFSLVLKTSSKTSKT